MGSCISKCCPKAHLFRDSHHLVQDKIVISQASPSISTTATTACTHLLPYHHHHRPCSKKPAVLPAIPNSPSPSSSSSSSCITTFSTSSYSTSSSTKSPPSSLSSPSFSSSTSSSKDRSFSNEFLWSCARQNPHLISSVDIGITTKSSTLVEASTKSSLHAVPKSKSLLKQRAQASSASTSQKRARVCSPNLTRQKSFRRSGEADHERVLVPHHQPTGISNSPSHCKRNLVSLSPSPSRRYSSPSPSRRYSNLGGIPAKNNNNNNNNQQQQQKQLDVLHKGNFKRKTTNAAPSISESVKENRVPREDDVGKVSKRSIETCKRHVDIHGQIHRNSDISGVGGVVSDEPLEMINSAHLLADDVDNPLISLDCFIFI